MNPDKIRSLGIDKQRLDVNYKGHRLKSRDGVIVVYAPAPDHGYVGQATTLEGAKQVVNRQFCVPEGGAA